ncbi:MAG: hypothetical protein K2Q03_02490 [Sphingobacteriaceae bacterium]|nr:hypothetical protein [Sphingobacteriaceae bacterium]
MIKNKTFLQIISISLLFFISSAFIVSNSEDETMLFIQNTLNSHFNKGANERILKNYEINLTKDGFFRCKKIYPEGKIEYFSFNLIKFKSLDFAGTEEFGDLYLKTVSDDVIVQTFHDREGDLDSMANYLVIPIKNLEMDSLILLEKNFSELHQKIKNR